MISYFYLLNAYTIPISIMKSYNRILAICFAIVTFSFSGISAQDKKALTVDDIMKFREIESPSISNDGQWIVYEARPDRGDPDVMVYSTDGKKKFSIERGENPVLKRCGPFRVTPQQIDE